MAKKTLIVDIPEDLHDIFVRAVTEEYGPWRNTKEGESYDSAIESAVVAALMLFLQGLGSELDLPEFGDYIRERYPFIDEDLVTMMNDLIEREKSRQN